MENNLINFDDLRNPNDEGNKFDHFCDMMKGDIWKGAYFVRQNDGNFYFGCTGEDKASQIVLLHRLKNVIDFYVDNYPNFKELEELANKLGKDKEELIDELYEEVDEEEEI